MMSPFLCFVCHSTVNADINEDTREKYKEVIGMNLCPDTYLCSICCYFINKMWMFKSICLKRSLEYPVLFSEKGTINLQRSETTVAILCPEDICIQHLNTKYHFNNNNENSQSDFYDNDYFELQDERNFDINETLLKSGTFENIANEDLLFTNKDNIDDNLFNEELILPNLEPVKVTQNDLVNGEWTQNNSTNENNKKSPVLSEPHKYRNEITIEGIIVPVPIHDNSVPIRIGEDNEPVSATIEEDDIPIIECSNTPNIEEVLMVNNIQYNPETNSYEQIGDTFDENIEKDINETIGINISDDIETNLLNMVINDNITLNLEPKNKAEEENSSGETDEEPSKRSRDIYDKVFLTLEQQKEELETARKDQKYIEASFKCHSCALHFHFKDTYQTHMMRHEESNGEYSCKVCSLRFASLQVLRKHTRNHGVRFLCKHCSEVVRERQRPTHARICLGPEELIKCSLCSNEFKSETHYTQHMQRFHKIKKSKNSNYPCSVCGKDFNSRSKVRTHMLTHINKKFSCDECKGVFSSPYTLTQHKKLKHELVEASLHHCTTCDVSYNSRKSLVAHYRTSPVHKDSLYKCASCGRVCATEDALANHVAAIHVRTRHLVCDYCHKRYSTKRSLVRHLETHKPTKPVPLCHSCGARFRTPSILKRHLRNVCEKEPRKTQIELDEELLQATFLELNTSSEPPP